MIGYGRYHYRYDSGREGNFWPPGFFSHIHLSIYVMPGYRDCRGALEQLGKPKLDKSCLYVNKLAEIDLAAL